MTPIKIKQATLNDLPIVAAQFDLYRQFYMQPPNASLALSFITERFANNESVILVAEMDGEGIVGFCQLYPGFCSVDAAPIYTLYDLFVLPSARQHGAGRLLLLAAESHARKNGKVRMDLTTAKTNLAAQSLYESLGWVRDEVFLSYSRHIPLA